MILCECGTNHPIWNLCPTCSGVPGAPKPDPLAQARKALDAKDALLRRCLAVLNAIHLCEPEIRPNANHIELRGYTVSQVCILCVAIEMEFEFVDPLVSA